MMRRSAGAKEENWTLGDRLGLMKWATDVTCCDQLLPLPAAGWLMSQ